MTLTVRLKRANGREVLLLCDEAGEPVPNQIETTLQTSGKGCELTIRLFIDGQSIRLVPSEAGA